MTTANYGVDPNTCLEQDLPHVWENEVPLTLTVGQIRARLADMPDEMPVIGYFSLTSDDEDNPAFEDYVNITDMHFDPTNPDIAVCFEVRDTYDTRQW